jgi:hypothetical protein
VLIFYQFWFLQNIIAEAIKQVATLAVLAKVCFFMQPVSFEKKETGN